MRPFAVPATFQLRSFLCHLLTRVVPMSVKVILRVKHTQQPVLEDGEGVFEVLTGIHMARY